MKIGIDISQIVYEGTGVAAYTKNLISSLKQVDQKNEYVYFGSSLRRRQKGFWPFPLTLMDVLWNRLHVLPVENFIGNVDIFHSSDWVQPPTRAKKVTTIHDLVVYKYPESSHPKIVATQKRRLEWVKKECDLVIADSMATKKDIIEFLKIPEEKIRVVYPAAASEFNEDAKPRLSDKPYILTVGTIEPRKNLSRLATALEKLNLKDYELVNVGKAGWGDQIKGLGYVPQKDMPALYKGASLFVYPSLYEGFGLPILEAMSVGCPVATSNVSSMPEVGGDAAVYFDPLDIDDMAEKISLALKNANEMKKKSLVQSKKFSWKKTALEILSIYEKMD